MMVVLGGIALVKGFGIYIEFSAESRTLSVEEPEDGAPPTTLTLTVQRVGGTVGVVSVSWRVIDSNGEDHMVHVAIMSS